MKKQLVVHCKRSAFDVYIGRPGPWGNPFSHLEQTHCIKVATRADAVAEYEKMLRADPDLVARAKRELKGKVLGCWCFPRACHGDVLAKVANE